LNTLHRIAGWSGLFFLSSLYILPLSYAQQPTLSEALGASADIIKNHTSAKSATMETVSVAESRKYAFISDMRMAGYPVKGTLRELNKQESGLLARLLAHDKNYINVLRRCKNQSFKGIRFNKKAKKIEVAIGLPCNQVLVAYADKNHVQWWGGILDEKIASLVLMLLEASSTTIN